VILYKGEGLCKTRTYVPKSEQAALLEYYQIDIVGDTGYQENRGRCDIGETVPVSERPGALQIRTDAVGVI
jgi:hypothetical protein